jgi:hypothetical protein
MLHPYDLLRNPFKFKNSLVILDVVSRPVLYNGTFVQYAEGYVDPRPGGQLSQTGLRFRKMVSQDTGLYDVMGLEGNFNASGDSDLLGEIAVVSSTQDAELDLDRRWKVEPLGTLQGTNAFGATLDVPVVRFWGYAAQVDGPSTPHE